MCVDMLMFLISILNILSCTPHDEQDMTTLLQRIRLVIMSRMLGKIF